VVLAVVTQTATLEEFEVFEQELKDEQKERLEECAYIDGSYRCEKCGSSIYEYGETTFLFVDKKTRNLTSTSISITGILYCDGCEKAPPMYSSVGVIRENNQKIRAEKEEKVAGKITKLG
jgi:hypothetical protein